jgi:hypothetical protein
MIERERTWALTGPGLRVLTYALIAIACAPTLYLRFLPMVDLPQYLALARMLMHLHDPAYDFGTYYELALDRSIAGLPLALLGALGELVPHEAAKRLFVFASVAIYPLALCALLRALRKPIALALLGLPLLYASPFFLGLVPSTLSMGLALLTIALLLSCDSDSQPMRSRRVALAAIALALPFTDPFGVAIVVSYLACAALTGRSSQRRLPWLWLSPLLLGAAYWTVRACFAEGVAGFNYPNLAFRLLRLPHQILGGFIGRGEALLLAAQVVLCVLFAGGARAAWTRNGWRDLPQPERALRSLWLLCVVGYLVLPNSTWTITAIDTRVGALAFALMPLLLPAADARGLRERGPALLLAFGIASAWYSTAQLVRFDREAAPLAAVLAQMPQRPRLLGLIYDNQGHVANSNPYLHVAAYAQAERGGYLSLSLADSSWTVPLRRRHDKSVPSPIYGSEWDPALFHVRPLELWFHNVILLNDREPREMTMLMLLNYRLRARHGDWLLYMRQ